MNTKFLIIFSILLLTASGNAAAEVFELYNVWSYNVGDQVGVVYMYDLYGDGTEEIVAASNKIHIFNKDGTLKAEPASKIAKISELQIIDLNNDGSNEIVITAGNQPHILDKNLNIISESMNVGVVGGFSIGNLTDSAGVEKLKIVVGGSNVYIFESDLKHPLIYRVNGSVSDVYVDDFDNDGQNEVISAGNGIYMIDNLDTLTEKDDLKLVNNKTKNIRRIYVSDLNKNGVKDILLETFFNVYGINKDSNYSRAWEYKTGGEVYDLKVADLDNDGKNELVMGASTDSEFAEFVYAFDIFGNVEWRFNTGRIKTGKEVAVVEVSDLNNDGKNEVIAGSGNIIYILDEKGNLIWKHEEAKDKINSIYISDLDYDGYKEIIAGSSDNKVYVFGVKKKEAEEESIGKNETGEILENITKIYISDLDNDGRNEIALGHSNYISILDRNLKLKFNYPTKGPVNGIYIGDVDGDTYNELVASDSLGNVYAIERTGYLIKEEQTNIKNNEMYYADLYNDGYYETIIATSIVDVKETKVYCTQKCCPPEVDRKHIPQPPEGFIGSGVCIPAGLKEEELVGVESTQIFSSERDYNEYMEKLDLNNYTIISEKRVGSGTDITIAVTVRTKPKGMVETAWERGRIYLRGSVRVFDGKNEIWKYELDSTVRTVFAADVNNDDYTEIIAGYDNGDVSLISRHGNLIKEYETEGPIRTVFAADLNNDNYPEIIAGSDDWSVYVFNFTANKSLWKYETGNIVYSVFAADLDNDGTTEVIAGSHDNYIYVFDSKGNLKSKNKTQGIIREIYAANVDNDEYKEIVLAGEKLNVLNFYYTPPEIPEEVFEINITETDVTDLVIISKSGKSIGSWDKTAGGKSADNGNSIAVDSDNNIIVTGGTNSFGAGNDDMWTMKYDSSGNLLWSKTLGGIYDDYGYGVAVDSYNNIIVTGGTNSSIATDADFWTIKYDQNGNIVWKKTAGGSSDDYGYSVAVDSDNNIIVTGLTGSFSEEGFNVWTIKYDSDGNMMWNKTAGLVSYDSDYHALRVAVDSANNIIVAGGTNSFGMESNDLWVIKYDSNGNVIWEKTESGGIDEWGQGVAVDSDNNIIITGIMWPYSAKNADALIIKYDASGNMLWNTTIGGDSNDWSNGVALDSENDIIVTGVTDSFGDGNDDVFIVLYYPNGSVIWSDTAGGRSVDLGTGIAIDSNYNVIVAGSTNSFGAGNFDAWIIKYTQFGSVAPSSLTEEDDIRKLLDESLDTLKENPTIIVAVVAVILAALFFISKRRKKTGETKPGETKPGETEKSK